MSFVKPVVYDGKFQRPMSLGDINASAELVGTLTTVGAGTLTGAVLATNILKRSGSTAAFTDTTDTANAIVAALTAISQPTAGDSWCVKYWNSVGYAATLAAGTGVTLAGNTVIPAGSTAELLIQLNNVTPSTVVACSTASSITVTGMTAAQTALISVGQLATGSGITAGTKVAAVVPGSGVILDTAATTTVALNSLTFAPVVTITNLSASAGGNALMPNTKFTSISAGNGTLSAGDMEGAADVTLASSGATAMTTRTADQIIAGMPNAVIGTSYHLRVYNTNGGTLTLTGGVGVTITGTATIATNVWRDYYVTYTAASTIVLQNLGAGAAT